MTDRILAQRHRLMTDENSSWWTLGAMCFALFMLMLDNTVVNVALPSIQRDLHASLSSLEWTVNAYTLTFAVLLVTGGRLGDIFGRRRMFLFGVVVFGLSSLAIGFAPSDTVLVAFRAVQGIGAAFMMPATLSIITQAFPPEQRGTAIGTWAGVSALALAIGPVRRRLPHRGRELAGDLLHQPADRRHRGRGDAVRRPRVARRDGRPDGRLRGHRHAHGRADRARARAGRGQQLALGLGRVISLLVLAAVALAAFVMIERRVRAPMVDFTFFRSRTSLGANIVAFLISFAMFAQFFFLTLYMQNVLHYSPLQTGVRFLPSTIVIIVMGPLAGRLTDRVGSRPLMTPGC